MLSNRFTRLISSLGFGVLSSWVFTSVLLFTSASAMANTPPTITSTPITSASEDSLYEYTITAIDDDGDDLTFNLVIRPTWITYNSSTNTISGIPTNSDVNTSEVRFTVSDGIETVEQVFNLTVANTNDAPTVTNNISNLNLTEDVDFELSVSSNFADEDFTDRLTFSADGLPTGLQISSLGLITGAPNNDDALNSPFTVTVTATDLAASSVSTDFQIAVINVNDAPQAIDDSVSVAEDGTTTIDILLNDVDVDNDLQPATAFITNTPVNGTALINTADGLVTYTPNPNYEGSDSFQYRITDPAGLVGTATVSITVLGENDPPVAQNDLVSTNEDETIAIDVIANDSDIDQGDSLQGDQIIIEDLPTNGQVTVSSGMVNYTPAANFSGSDSFTYKVADSNGEYTNVATVTIIVGPVNDFPTANNDIISTAEDQEVEFAVVNNDTDTEDCTVSASTIEIVNQPTNGTLSLNTSGTLTYTPSGNFNGEDTLQYTVTDSSGYRSNAATVTITVRPVNDNPQANNDLVVVNEDNQVDINILGNDTDIDDPTSLEPSSVSIVTQPTNGIVFIDTTTGIVKYTPNENYNGNDEFSYQMKDTGSLTSNTATVAITVNPVNDAPKLTNDSATTDEDNSITIDIIPNDIDIDGSLNTSTLEFTQQPAHGTVSFNSSGQVVYTPELNYNGNDQFSYSLKDDLGLAAQTAATVVVTINSINDQPIANDDSNQVNEDKTLSITLTGSDVDEDVLTYNIITQPVNGTLTGNNATWTYLPDANYNGSDAFTFTATDGDLTSFEATFSIDVISVNDRPVANEQSLVLNEDESINITLTGSDIDNDALTFRLSGGNVSGIITGSAPNITYTPALNFNGNESISFIANDGELDSASETIYLRVDPVNDQPTVSDQDLFLSEDSSISFTLEGQDIDGDALTYTVSQQPTNGTLSGTGQSLIYTPATNFNGEDSLTYYVNDGTVDSSIATVKFSVSATGDEPVAYNQAVSTLEDTSIAITLSGEDPDGTAVNFRIVTPPTNGTLTGDAPNIVYIGDEDFNGTDIVEFQVSDGTFDSNTATVSITIDPVNDAPDAMDDEYNLSMTGKNWLTLNVLENDEDIDGDSLTLQSVSSDFGAVAINNNQVRFVPQTGFNGQVNIQYIVADPHGLTSAANVLLTVRNNGDNNAPQITTSGDINLIAEGPLTRVSFESATAIDAEGNNIGVELIDSQQNFPPGAHNIFWQATDAQGRTAIASQKVNIYPLVSLSRAQVVEEGDTTKVVFKLNGPAPVYPIVIPYTIEGTATFGIDYEMPTGEVRFNEGTAVAVDVLTYNDQSSEVDETIDIIIGQSNYASAQDRHTIYLTEQNYPPRSNIMVMQDQQYRYIVAQNGADITLSAQVFDPNPNDSHTIQWQVPDAFTQLNDAGENTYVFSAADIATGRYQVGVIVTDNSPQASTNYQQIYIDVVSNLSTLGGLDTDGDLATDSQEGHGDDDQDGIANYLDAIDDCRLMPQVRQQTKQFLLQSQTGSCLRLGQYHQGNILVDTDTLPDSDDTQFTSGVFDFIIHSIDNQQASTDVVIPQRQPIPSGAVYLKYTQTTGWSSFTLDDKNAVYSAIGRRGLCPEPKSSLWQQGLNEGHWCVRLTIEDGGPNDDDGLKNQMISDPSGVAIFNSNNTTPVAEQDFESVIWNSEADFAVLANDTDADNDPLTIINVEATIGQVEILDLGSEQPQQLHYTALENFIGEDVVNYSISDGNGGIASSTLTITVIGNSIPEAADDSAQVRNDQTVSIKVLLNDSDADGDTLTISGAQVSASQGTVTINADQLVFDPQANFEGTAIINYQISDGKGGEDEAQVFVTVTKAPDNNPPPADNDNNDSGGDSGGGGHMGWLLLFMVLIPFRYHGPKNASRRCRIE